MVPQCRNITYATYGRCILSVDVYPSHAHGPTPAVIWLHGGGLIFGTRKDIPAEQVEAYTRAGLCIIAADYRLAPETKLPEIVGDVVELYAWVRKTSGEWNVDPDRIAVVGHSAGAYLSLMCGAVLEPRPRAIVSFYGYGDILGDWYAKPSPHYCQQELVSEDEAWRVLGSEPIAEDCSMSRWPFYLYCRQQGLWTRLVTGHDPQIDGVLLARYCPVRLVDDRYPPTLFLHGDEDTDVPLAQSADMRAALDAAGVECRLTTIAGGGHGFERYQAGMPEAQLAMKEAVEFLSQHLSV